MATFKAEVRTDHQRADKTFNVRIRVTHDRKIKRIPTGIYVRKDELTKTGKIKNAQINDELEEIIRTYRKKCNSLSVIIDTMSVDEVVDFITRPDEKLDVDFFEFSEKWIGKNQSRTAYIHQCALNAIERFIGRRRLDFREINYKFLKSLEEYLGRERRRCSLYMSSIRFLYNEAKKEYNDEDVNRILIPWSPFSKYSIPVSTPDRVRCVDEEIIRQIYNFPYDKMQRSRVNIAKDMFILSFCLMGTNTADLYMCDEMFERDGKTFIAYNRQKTKTRRTDKARMEIEVHPFIRTLFDKYRGKKRVFSLCERFCDYTQLNKSVNRGLKKIGKELGINDLEFYAARHTFASIARNKLGIDKATVGEALNHVDKDNKITDIYIKKDYSIVNEVNRKVIEYVFKEEGE